MTDLTAENDHSDRLFSGCDAISLESGGRWIDWRQFTWIVAVLMALSTLWSLATPLGGGADEPVHLIRASALVHGQLTGTPLHGISPWTSVRTSEALASAERLPYCFEFRPSVPAGCQPALSASNRQSAVHIYVGRYPPLYYLAVGWPSLLVSNPTVLFYVTRAVSGILCCALMGLALAMALRRRERLLLVGVLVGATPMVLYMTAIINPNSLEVCAALALWTGALVLADRVRSGSVPRGLISMVVAVAVVLVLTRPDTPLWVLLIGVSTFPILAGRPWREFVRRRDARIGAAAIVAAAVVAVAWIVGEHATQVMKVQVPASAGMGFLIRASASRSAGYFVQALGEFGWFDAASPALTDAIWILALGGLLLIAWTVGRRSERISLALTVTLSVVVPIALSVAVARHNGFIGQGRYFLALYVGMPLVASYAIGRDPLDRVTSLVLPCCALGQVLAFAWTLHRYSVGVNGPLSPDAHVAHEWYPPVPWPLLDVLFVVACAAASWLLLRSWRSSLAGAARNR